MSTTNIAKRPDDADLAITNVGKTKHPASVIMLGVVGSDGKVFQPYWTNRTMDAEQYTYLPSHKAFPALNSTYDVRKCLWMQAGALALTSTAISKTRIKGIFVERTLVSTVAQPEFS